MAPIRPLFLSHPEARRDHAMAAYHHYELASGAVQIAIMLASAMIITGMSVPGWLAVAGGLIGEAFSLIGVLAPTAFHLF